MRLGWLSGFFSFLVCLGMYYQYTLLVLSHISLYYGICCGFFLYMVNFMNMNIAFLNLVWLVFFIILIVFFWGVGFYLYFAPMKNLSYFSMFFGCLIDLLWFM